MQDPKFVPGEDVYIWKIGKTKKVVEAYSYKGAEWAYLLVDENGVEDEGWREDELRRPRVRRS